MSVFSDHEDMVQALYIGFFGRAGDPAGVAYWSAKLSEHKTTWPQMAAAFAVQKEALSNYPFLARHGQSDEDQHNAREFVTKAYQELLGRRPDPGGLDYWVGVLLGSSGQHVSGVQFILGLLSGAEPGSVDDLLIKNKIEVARHFTRAQSSTGEVFDKSAAQHVVDGVNADSMSADS